MIVTTAVIKGGTGKSTTAAALAQAAALESQSVLCIDLDPQTNLSSMIGGDQRKAGADRLLRGTAAEELIQETGQGISIITGSPNLAVETTKPGSSRRLRQALQPIAGGYDLIVIDCPPSFGELVYLGIDAADLLLIPLLSDAHSLQGLYQIVDIADQIKANDNHDLRIAGSVICRYDGRSKLHQFYRDTIARIGSEIGAPLIGTIRSGVAVEEAQAYQRSLYDYAPKSKPAQDYRALYKQVFHA